MCGIVGLFLKDPALEPHLGQLTAQMLQVMSDRGPDSAGFAVYSAAMPECVKLTLRGPKGADLRGLAAELSRATGLKLPVVPRDDHAVLTVPTAREAELRALLAEQMPGVRVAGAGKRMELYKGVGLPAAVSARFGLPGITGTHAIGHTRMATESAVTTAGAHPFSTGTDQCLVHNGSLSNHNDVRRRLPRRPGTGWRCRGGHTRSHGARSGRAGLAAACGSRRSVACRSRPSRRRDGAGRADGSKPPARPPRDRRTQPSAWAGCTTSAASAA